MPASSSKACQRTRWQIASRLLLVLAPACLIASCPAVALASDDSVSAQAVEKECPVKTNTAKPGAVLKPPVELAPTQQSAQKLVNFGTSRQFKVIKHLTVTANKPLPPDLLPDQINYDAVLSRTGSTLETAEFPEPTFSPAYISHDRRSISFAVCLNPVGIAAGKYVGSITVSGPEGLGSTAVNVTVNAKKKQTLAWLIALIAAGWLLLMKDTAAAKNVNAKLTWRRAFQVPLSSPLWWTATVITLGAAFAALVNIYSSDPAWGASGFASLVSSVGAATAAIGGHAILTMGSKHGAVPAEE